MIKYIEINTLITFFFTFFLTLPKLSFYIHHCKKKIEIKTNYVVYQIKLQVNMSYRKAPIYMNSLRKEMIKKSKINDVFEGKYDDDDNWHGIYSWTFFRSIKDTRRIQFEGNWKNGKLMGYKTYREMFESVDKDNTERLFSSMENFDIARSVLWILLKEYRHSFTNLKNFIKNLELYTKKNVYNSKSKLEICLSIFTLLLSDVPFDYDNADYNDDLKQRIELANKLHKRCVQYMALANITRDIWKLGVIEHNENKYFCSTFPIVSAPFDSENGCVRGELISDNNRPMLVTIERSDSCDHLERQFELFQDMQKCNHPNVIGCLDFVRITDTELYFIYQHVELTLEDIMEKYTRKDSYEKGIRMPSSEIAKIYNQLVLGLKSIHLVEIKLKNSYVGKKSETFHKIKEELKSVDEKEKKYRNNIDINRQKCVRDIDGEITLICLNQRPIHALLDKAKEQLVSLYTTFEEKLQILQEVQKNTELLRKDEERIKSLQKEVPSLLLSYNHEVMNAIGSFHREKERLEYLCEQEEIKKNKIAGEKVFFPRNIKPDRIIFDNERYKIASLGRYLRMGADISGACRTICGNPSYIAPEVMKGQGYSHESEIYSLGVILFEMIFGRLPDWNEELSGMELLDGLLSLDINTRRKYFDETLTEEMVDQCRSKK
ncbi:MAG: hypothetical protein Satyrvirus8_23 [Satyrvirus sp.]|uniref:Protein kinase domain-containing protein n=1 Tax=Satyrvirus sp. TaxID=2487771 RepID=A0A3G5ADG2_9VIRU|nr:MAG: hypothetical protein Satyrvirus8_23 [Satyrvirus sp.]